MGRYIDVEISRSWSREIHPLQTTAHICAIYIYYYILYYYMYIYYIIIYIYILYYIIYIYVYVYIIYNQANMVHQPNMGISNEDAELPSSNGGVLTGLPHQKKSSQR